VATGSIAHVVWDWNGTLLDDAELIIAATNSSFVAAGHGAVSPQVYRRHFVRPLQRFYERLLERPVSVQEAAELDGAFHVDYLGLVEQAGLRADAIAALDAVPALGVKQSLLSMWPHDYLLPLVERLGLASYFALIEGNRNRGEAGKTDALHRHLAALGLVEVADRVLMIGDTVDDADAAVATGCRCVLIDSGHTAPGALEATGHPVVTSLLAAVAIARMEG
jgi:phosphoglycolate phosphatase-like HAD superfamily hydrolase